MEGEKKKKKLMPADHYIYIILYDIAITYLILYDVCDATTITTVNREAGKIETRDDDRHIER